MALNEFKVSLFCVALFLVSNAITSVFTETDSAELKEFVVSLDHTNFTDYVGKSKFVTVIEFYVSWCGPCKNFAPQFEKAAEILSKEDPPVVFAKVDASELRNSFLVYAFDIVNHPAIKILRNGGDVIQTYLGPHDTNGSVYFMRKGNRPATSELKSADEVNALVGEKMIVIVGIFSEFSGEKYENFTAVAERLHSKYEYELRHTSDAKLLPYGYSSTTSPAVRMFKPFDELFLDFQEFDVELLEKAIDESSAPTVSFHDHDTRTRPYMMNFFASGDDSRVIMLINSTHDQQLDDLKAKFHEVAQVYKGKGLRFAIMDVNADVELHTFKDHHVPLVTIQTNDGNTYVKPNIEPDQILIQGR